MYTFDLEYSDGNNILCEHVKTVIYFNVSGRNEISGQEILTHCYDPNRMIYLQGKERNYSLSTKDLRCISIIAE